MYLLQTDQHRRGRRSHWPGVARATLLAAPLRPKQRGRFLDLVSKYLAGCEVGDATVHMAGLRAQQELRREEPWLQA